MEVKKIGIYEIKRYFALALDPIYIGTGGYRIGRVDNTIIREPATGIPKIPATSIAGCCRTYSFLRAKESNQNIPLECASGKPKGNKEPCGKCAICLTFGYSKRDSSMQAMALFSDARILFFPIATMIGPVWITCAMILRDAGISVKINNKDGGLKEFEKLNETFIAVRTLENVLPQEERQENEKDSRNVITKVLNFGWLLMRGKCMNITFEELAQITELNPILDRVIVLPDSLFSAVINSNLEVRTSVAIDPTTGAGEEGALFTYEAIPRGTIFWFDVCYQNPSYFQVAGSNIKTQENNRRINIQLIKQTVHAGLKLFEHLGIGGMGSRGFGRLRVLNIEA